MPSPDAPAQPSQLEDIKQASGYLHGTVDTELVDGADGFDPATTQVLKFHGIYQQDDRDVRRQRQRDGLGKALSCMVRASIPGGILSSQQYLACDDLTDAVGGDSLRITTRQGLQWHFVAKDELQHLIRTLNEHLVTTLAACGDVARNTMGCPAPLPGRHSEELHQHAAALTSALRPRGESYWRLWLDGEQAVSSEPMVGDLEDEREPLYGPTYLPRKFKVGFAPEGDNCVDAHSQDVGIVPRHGDDGALVGFTLLVGGGLGMSHNNDATFPRLADPFTTVAPDRLVPTVAAIVAVQRDHGDRSDRKHARMKYLVEDWGLERFRAAVEEQLGEELPPVDAELDWSSTDDHLGWHGAEDGSRFLGLRIPAGRIVDHDGGPRFRTALRELADRFATEVRFTPRQDVLLVGIDPADVDAVDAVLADHEVPHVATLTPLARHAMACPALPTCGLALAEAERVMLPVVDELQGVMDEVGVGDEAVHVRMTGCPNGCARPYSTEVGLVGRGKDHYTVFLGGSAEGDRLNTEFADRVARAEVPGLLSPVLAAWRDERTDGQAFGDWCDAVGAEALRDRFAATTS